MTTGWMVYRCDECHTTTYVNANPRHPPVMLCCDQAKLVDVADEAEFCDALRATVF